MGNDRWAFSLIELMVVIAIVAVLAAVAVPSYKQYITRSKILNAMNTVHTLKTIALEYYNKNGTFPPTIATMCGTLGNYYNATEGNTFCNSADTSTYVGMGLIGTSSSHLQFSILFTTAFAGDANARQLYYAFVMNSAGILNVYCGGWSAGFTYNLGSQYMPSACPVTNISSY